MALRSALSGFIASFSFILIAISLNSYPALESFIAKYPLYIMIIAFVLFMFRDKILDKLNIHNGD